MVGDSYNYDYMAAKDIGVDALWIENTVSRLPEFTPGDLKSIKELGELLKYI